MFNIVKIKEVKVEIGQLAKGLRKRDKLSQQELGDLLGLSRITIQNLESGKNFTINTLLKVLQHFDLLRGLNQQLIQFREDNEDIESLY